MFCTKCGSYVLDTDNPCGECGNSYAQTPGGPAVPIGQQRDSRKPECSSANGTNVSLPYDKPTDGHGFSSAVDSKRNDSHTPISQQKRSNRERPDSPKPDDHAPSLIETHDGIPPEKAHQIYEKLCQDQINETKKIIGISFVVAPLAFAIAAICQHIAGTSMFQIVFYQDSMLLTLLAQLTFYPGWLASTVCVALGIKNVISLLKKRSAGLSESDVAAWQDEAASMEAKYPDLADELYAKADKLAAVLEAMKNKHQQPISET